MQRQTKQDYAYETIRDSINNSADGYVSGDVITEEELCERLGISRTPIREAIRRLMGEGLVEVTPGVGMKVSQIRLEDMLEIFEMREGLECLAIRLFIEKFDAEAANMLKTYMEAIESAYNVSDYGYFSQNDIDFHRIIAIGAKNERLRQSLDGLYQQIHRMAVPALKDSALFEFSVTQHRLICNAALGLDTDAAVSSSIEHNRQIKAFYLRRYYNI